MDTELIDYISEYVARANDDLVRILELNPDLYQGNAQEGTPYGFSVPRQISRSNATILTGYQPYTWTIDYLTEFIIPKDANIQQETSKCLLKVNAAIAELNFVTGQRQNAMSGEWKATRINAVQSQMVREPHQWQVTIVGEAEFTTWMYHDRCGRPIINC